jgi:hypothetical protein
MKSTFVCLFLAASMAAAESANPIRIFVVGSQTLQLSGDASIGETDASLQVAGGSSKEYVEVLRNFMKHCPAVIITSNQDRADYVVRIEHEAANPGTLFERANKVAIYNKEEDLIYTNATRFLSSAVKDACRQLKPPTAAPEN